MRFYAIFTFAQVTVLTVLNYYLKKLHEDTRHQIPAPGEYYQVAPAHFLPGHRTTPNGI